MFRQTWLGLVCLASLPKPNIAPSLSRFCPRLSREVWALTPGYKGRSAAARSARARLVEAIDAVLAGLAALKAHEAGFPTPPPIVLDEGWIYGL
jgi:hypothetical protein